MFDVGFWELVVLAIVALLIVGPDKLPILARETGKHVGALRRFADKLQKEFKQEFMAEEKREMEQHLEELDKLMKDAPDRQRKRSDN